MPRVTVTSSSSFVRNLYGSHIIACFAESLVYAPWVSWFKNDDQSLGYSSINGSNYKITYLFTTNEINVTHYTCSARNSVGIVTNATVSVVVRGEMYTYSITLYVLTRNQHFRLTRRMELVDRQFSV